MRNIYETTSLYMVGGTAIASAGTVTATGTAFSTLYEPDSKLVVSVGATPSGTLIYRYTGGTAAADTANVIALGTVQPALGGTLTVNAFGTVAYPYHQCVLIATGGTVLASANIEGKLRTLTL